MEKFGTGLASGIVATIFGKKSVRSVVKAIIKTGLAVKESLATAVSESMETLSDLVAEARQDLQREQGREPVRAPEDDRRSRPSRKTSPRRKA
jgi:hypothetical protein